MQGPPRERDAMFESIGSYVPTEVSAYRVYIFDTCVVASYSRLHMIFVLGSRQTESKTVNSPRFSAECKGGRR